MEYRKGIMVFALVTKSDYHDERERIIGIFSSPHIAKVHCFKNNLTLDNSNEQWHEIENYYLNKPDN